MPQLTKPTTSYVRTTSCKLVSAQTFSDMWNTGVKIREIANHYNIGAHEVKELRKRLGLPSRESIRYTFEPTTQNGSRYVHKDKLIRLFESGIPIKTIAEELGIPEKSCYYLLIKRLGLSRPKLPRGRCPATIEKENRFKELYKAGKSYKKISATLGLSMSRCYCLRMELGL